MNERFIRVLMVEPMKYPRAVHLESTMSALKSAVSIGCDELCEVKAKNLKRVFMQFLIRTCFTIL